MDLPGCKNYFKWLETRLIHNYTLTIYGTHCTLVIYGPEVANLKSNTARKKLEMMRSTQEYPILLTILDKHREEALGADYIYVQYIPYVHTVEGTCKFRMIEVITNKLTPNKKDMIYI